MNSRRVLDVVLCAALIALLLPVVGCLRAIRRPGTRMLWFRGRLGRPTGYRVERLVRSRSFRAINHWRALWLVLADQLGLTGPRAAGLRAPRRPYVEFNTPPGIVTPEGVNQRMNIVAPPGTSVALAAEWARATPGTRISLLLRHVVATAFGGRTRPGCRRVDLLDIAVDNIGLETCLERIEQLVARRGQLVSFVNAHCFNVACGDPDYRMALARSALVLADGIGVHIAFRWLLRKPLRANLNGTDLLPHLCALASRRQLRVFLLGGAPGVAEKAAQALLAQHPQLQVVGTQHGYWHAEEVPAVIGRINAARPDLLLAGLGVPLQETWLAQHRASLDVGVSIAVGGLFDFASGRIPRAPLWLRQLGLEWSYRMLQEPRRMWRRYLLGNPLFLLRAWRWSRRQQHASVRVSGRDVEAS